MRTLIVLGLLASVPFLAMAQNPPASFSTGAPIATGLAPGQYYIYCMQNIQTEIANLKGQGADPDYIKRLADNAVPACQTGGH
jgi:hypothetical protein